MGLAYFQILTLENTVGIPPHRHNREQFVSTHTYTAVSTNNQSFPSSMLCTLKNILLQNTSQYVIVVWYRPTIETCIYRYISNTQQVIQNCILREVWSMLLGLSIMITFTNVVYLVLKVFNHHRHCICIQCILLVLHTKYKYCQVSTDEKLYRFGTYIG